MEDRTQEILGQYGFLVNNVKKARGAQLLDTDEGVLLLASTSCRDKRLAMENRIKEHLKEQGYDSTDIYVKNMEGRYLTQDRYGNGYVVKHWFIGEEVVLNDLEQVYLAAKNLGKLHRLMTGVFEEDESPVRFGGDNENLIEQMGRHNRELKRVYSYILGKNQKNEFENLYLALYNNEMEHAVAARKIIEGSLYGELLSRAVKKGEIIHGSYNQHKVIITDNGIATIDFSKAQTGLQLLDFYHFLRKTLEKNDWDGRLAEVAAEAYQSEKEITGEEWKILYGLFLYPEKFRKAANYYNNTRKSWVSTRTSKKLTDVKEQYLKRQDFIENILKKKIG